MPEKKKKQEPKGDVFSDTRMSLGEHLDELRSRLLKSIYGIVAALVVCLIFGNEIFGFLAQPLLLALESAGREPEIYVQSLPEAFITYIKVALFSALFLSAPWTFYQLWGFIGVGLYRKEKRFVNVFVPFSSVMFILGGVFFITIVAPISFNFFIKFGSNIHTPELSDNLVSRMLRKAMTKEKKDNPDSENPNVPEGNGETKNQTDLEKLVHALQDDPGLSDETKAALGAVIAGDEKSKSSMIKPIFTFQKYVSLVLVLALAFSLAFQMPLVVLCLGRLGLVRVETLCSVRKYVMLGILVVAAVMTPPDIISQVFLGVPMYILYEFGIILVRIWPKKKKDTVPR